MPIVRPEWITASIDAGEVLPVEDFALGQIQDPRDQRLDAFLQSHDDDPREDTEMMVDMAPEGDAEKEMAYLKNADQTPGSFIRSYFEHSRLHFIGTWKLRIEGFLQRQRNRGPKPARTGASRDSRPSAGWPWFAGDRQILHIDMDCFFASVALLTRPELRDVPFVVCHSSNRNGTAEISCANYPARRFGIRAGSFISSALEKCPALRVVPYQFQQYHEISEQVFGALCLTQRSRMAICLLGVRNSVELQRASRAGVV